MTMIIEQNNLTIGADIDVKKAYIEFYEFQIADLEEAIIEYKILYPAIQKRELVIGGKLKNNEVFLYFTFLNEIELLERQGFYIQLSNNGRIEHKARELHAMNIKTSKGIKKKYFLIDIV